MIFFQSRTMLIRFLKSRRYVLFDCALLCWRKLGWIALGPSSFVFIRFSLVVTWALIVCSGIRSGSSWFYVLALKLSWVGWSAFRWWCGRFIQLLVPGGFLFCFVYLVLLFHRHWGFHLCKFCSSCSFWNCNHHNQCGGLIPFHWGWQKYLFSHCFYFCFPFAQGLWNYHTWILIGVNSQM